MQFLTVTATVKCHCHGLLTCHWILHNWIPFLSFEISLCTVIEKVFSHIECLSTIHQIKPTSMKYNKHGGILQQILHR